MLGVVFLVLEIMTLCGTGPWAAVPKGITRKVAIIGGGASGVSTAYYLAASCPLDLYDTLEITMFDRSASLGGRCTAIRIPGTDMHVELGAPSINTAHDTELMGLVKDLKMEGDLVAGGRWAPVETRIDVGIYDGHRFVYRQPYRPGVIWRWWNSLSYFVHYGRSHKNFDSMNRWLLPLWRTFTGALRLPGSWSASFAPSSDTNSTSASPNPPAYPSEYPPPLFRAVTTPANTYLGNHKVKAPFSTEQIQARLRARYGANLGVVSGMHAAKVMGESERASNAIVRGNSGIAGVFEKIVAAANRQRAKVKVDVKLATPVWGISKNITYDPNENPTVVGWTVAYGTDDGEPELDVHETQFAMGPFDDVIVAAPWPSTKMLMDPEYSMPHMSYEHMYVIVFMTLGRLVSGVFGLKKGDTKGVPSRIWSTLAGGEQGTLGGASGESGVGGVGWWSVEHVGNVVKIVWGGEVGKEEVEQVERVYKILSPREMSDEAIKGMLGGAEITWVHRHYWEYAFATPVFDQLPGSAYELGIKVDDGLWYTGSMEGKWGGLEAAVVMGKRVAEDIVDGWRVGKLGVKTAKGTRKLGESA
ncbi:hypothetical protein BDZ91DRAFT_762222 [Kalaharituber pfeilii]|nr:hypothetical protein BDZ91DRAFT_762222 [Kalaharituber pfeilii]